MTNTWNINYPFPTINDNKTKLMKKINEKRYVQMWAEYALLCFNVRHSIVLFIIENGKFYHKHNSVVNISLSCYSIITPTTAHV